jgi:class 3 adenylate cyclase/predicted ATPase
MDFYEVLDQVIDLLQRRGRVTYRALKLQFMLNDDQLETLKEEILFAHPQVASTEERGLVWIGGTDVPLAPALPSSLSVQPLATQADQAAQTVPDAERRQLTVMFCDLVGSTPLSEQLDPEDLREVVRAYQQTCAKVVQRFDGHIAQLLGDALLVYFGWPQAHEDDAQRAVRTGLGMLDAMGILNARLEQDEGVRLAIRVGIHTGLVVVGEMGGGGHHEQLALGDTPNIASRLLGLAQPDTVVISAATFRLVAGYFTVADLGHHPLRGVATPMQIYRILGESATESRFEAATTTGLTPLIGREEEVALVLRRWEQAKEGEGQVVLLAGEPGIGKSRIIQAVREHVAEEPHIHLRYQCSPYYRHSAFYPVIAQLERAARFVQDDTPAQKLDKLESILAQSTERVDEVAPFLAALLSIPAGDRYPPLHLSPQRQKAQTMAALVDQLVGLSHHHPVLFIFEDAHWSDPTSLEVLDLAVNRVHNARVLVVIAYRPEFAARWGAASYVTALTLNRLSRSQSTELVTRLTAGKVLPPVVLDQILVKSDGVPLFVEELTKTILESHLLQEMEDHYALTGPLPPLAIPATLQDSLMARLDRLAPAKEVAQVGAAIGREFAYEVLAAVVPLRRAELETALHQLVEAELLFRRGQPPEMRYVFKHALIQDAAYQSLLKNTRQQLHMRIAQVLEAQFPAICTAEPEVLGHHYTEAGLHEQAVTCWQRAGERAVARSANVEAIAHFTRGLEAHTALPDSAERHERELTLQLALGRSWMASKGYAAPEVRHVYARAQELCRQMGDPLRVSQVLLGLGTFYFVRGAFQTARDLGEQCLSLVQRLNDTVRLQQTHLALGTTSFHLGALVQSREHLEQSIALHTPRQSHVRAVQDPRVASHAYAAWVLWVLGYPTQALQKSHGAIALADELAHQLSRVYALLLAATLHQHRREAQAVHERTEAAMAVSIEQDFLFWQALGTVFRGWVLVEQGQGDEGIALISQGIVAWQATGAEMLRPYILALQAEAYGNVGQADTGVTILDEALMVADKHDERIHEAELYRLKGELLLQQEIPDTQQAAACFHQALDIARHQQAKSWELRAAMSLSRLWQRQGTQAEARELLAPVYGWFTEGFDTADLQEAKALLEELRA